MRTGWPSAANSFAPVSRSRHWTPSKDIKTPSLDQLQDATSVLDACHIVKLAGDAPGEGRRRVQQDTTGHRGRTGDPLYHIRLLLRASRDRLTKRQQERLHEAFTANEAHISVKVAYRCAQHVRDVFHQATPAQDRRLATHLIQRLPARPIPEIARLGPDPTQTEGRTRRLLRHSRSQQRTPPKPSTDIIERGRRTTRGYPNPTNYQLRMLLITGGLDASTHTQL